MLTTSRTGFTLAELLIALAILGLIAMFTIPKILSSQQMAAENTKGKEMAAAISKAYQMYLKDKRFQLPAATYPQDLIPYMNYTHRDTSSFRIDGTGPGYENGIYPCSDAGVRCYRFQNGGVLYNIPTYGINLSGSSNAVWYYFDPDGVNTYGSGPAANGPGRSIMFFLYGNGRIATWASLKPATTASGLGVFNATPNRDPVWFSWSN